MSNIMSIIQMSTVFRMGVLLAPPVGLMVGRRAYPRHGGVVYRKGHLLFIFRVLRSSPERCIMKSVVSGSQYVSC